MRLVCRRGRLEVKATGRYHRTMPLAAVNLAVIERVFEVLDRLGISREAVVIPLKPEHPGGARRLPNGKIEIRVESETPLDEWLPELENALRGL
jgi:hypothetical protein